MSGDVWSLLGMLAMVILILVAAYWVTRWIGIYGTRFSGTRGRAPGGAGRFTVLARLGLGRGEELVLVRLDDVCLLVGVTAGGISLLQTLEGEQAQRWLEPDADPASAPGFLDVLKENLRKRK